MMRRFAVVLVRLWTRVFTLGMPPTVRAWRRAEIESDLWEQDHDRSASAAEMLGRLFRGIPADVVWRIEEESMRSRAVVVVAASVGIILAAAAVWLYDTMRADTLPTPPPGWIRAGAPGRIVPPPPPPDPPDNPLPGLDAGNRPGPSTVNPQ